MGDSCEGYRAALRILFLLFSLNHPLFPLLPLVAITAAAGLGNPTALRASLP